MEQMNTINRKGNYPWHCTGCGRELDGEKVLYDMTDAVLGEETNFLSLRVTARELQALLMDLEEGDLRETLSLKTILEFMANENNLNNAAIRELTAEQIAEYLEEAEKYRKEQEKKWDEIDIFSLCEPEDEKEIPPYFLNLPRGIQALFAHAEECESFGGSVKQLEKDLRILFNRLSQAERMHCPMKPITERDDKGEDVLVGVRTEVNGRKRVFHNRICPHCQEPVFDHAGTSEQKKVLFIGPMASGKTSAILALAHYARDAMMTVFADDPIWSGSEPIGEVRSVELLTPSERLKRELAFFDRGFAPEKTGMCRRSGIYSATLRITGGEGDRHLLTLMEFPGELMGWDGRLNQDIVINEFSTVLACDAMVVCMEAQTTHMNPEWMYQTRNIFRAVDELQQLRISQGAKGCAPTMLLYTKWDDLEAEKTMHRMPPAELYAPWERQYMLLPERERMMQWKWCAGAESLFARMGELTNAFRASLGISAYGYPAPNRHQQEFCEPACTPKPVHVDKLMRWLLTVTGCIPVRTAAPVEDPKLAEAVKDYRLERTQYRRENPRVEGGSSPEALARCVLFSNPGVHDRHFMEHSCQRMKGMLYRMRMGQDSNNG